MSLFSLPAWVEPHLFAGKVFVDLSASEKSDLIQRLAKFKSDTPDVSVVIPTWNDADTIHRTLSSLAANITSLRVEIVVINNNSTDSTQDVLDALGIRNYLQPIQGTPHARQMGLYKAKGKYHLCADSDTLYPPDWIELMVKPMKTEKGVVGVYSRYSFIPPPGTSRLSMVAYEAITGMLIRLRKINREHINVLGFCMGFITEIGRANTGFEVREVRKYDNALGSDYFVDEAEDGKMALNLKKHGKLKLITNNKARVVTSSRRLSAEGGVVKAFVNRMLLHTQRIGEYIGGKKIEE